MNFKKITDISFKYLQYFKTFEEYKQFLPIDVANVIQKNLTSAINTEFKLFMFNEKSISKNELRQLKFNRKLIKLQYDKKILECKKSISSTAKQINSMKKDFSLSCKKTRFNKTTSLNNDN